MVYVVLCRFRFGLKCRFGLKWGDVLARCQSASRSWTPAIFCSRSVSGCRFN